MTLLTLNDIIDIKMTFPEIIDLRMGANKMFQGFYKSEILIMSKICH